MHSIPTRMAIKCNRIQILLDKHNAYAHEPCSPSTKIESSSTPHSGDSASLSHRLREQWRFTNCSKTIESRRIPLTYYCPADFMYNQTTCPFRNWTPRKNCITTSVPEKLAMKELSLRKSGRKQNSLMENKATCILHKRARTTKKKLDAAHKLNLTMGRGLSPPPLKFNFGSKVHDFFYFIFRFSGRTGNFEETENWTLENWITSF